MGGTTYLLKLGAKSRWASFIIAVSAAAIILLFAPQISKIPLSALAALLMYVGYQTINVRDIRLIWRTNPSSRALMLVTFVATLFLPLQHAIFFGVAVSFAVFAYSESENTTIVQVEVDEATFSDEVKQMQALAQSIQRKIKDYFTVSVKVKLVEPRTIPRSEGKAKRVIDKRQL